MFINLFGKYLVSEGIITSDQLEDIKQEQSKARVKMGLIAVAEKMLTDKQADEINRKQAVEDKRFGDIAIECGYLTLEDVSRLLDLQGNPYMQFCQIVTDKEYLTLEQVENAIAGYQKDNNFSDEMMDGIKAGDLDVIIPIFVKDEAVSEAAGIAIRTLNRLISTDLWMDHAYIVEKWECDNSTWQNLIIDCEYFSLGFAGWMDSLLTIAGAYANETFYRVDMDAMDSVAEVVNIINGLYATALSHQGKYVDLMPPEFFDGNTELKGTNMYVIPLEINQQPLMMVISCNSKITV